MRRSPAPAAPVRRLTALAPTVLSPLAFVAAILLTWEVAVRLLDTPTYLLPRPSLLPTALPAEMWSHVWVTTQEVLLGFVLANVLAFGVAVSFAQSAWLERGLYPVAIAMKTTPLVAIAPLLVLWFGTGLTSKVVAAALISFFPMLVNTIKGLRAADADQEDLFRALQAGRWQRLRRLQMPTALPFVFAALKISSSLAVVGAIVGEFVGANKGLGFVILQASYRLDTPQLFVGIGLAAALGLTLFGLVTLLERVVCTWERVDA